jgi:hypothetical protein
MAVEAARSSLDDSARQFSVVVIPAANSMLYKSQNAGDTRVQPEHKPVFELN